MYRAEAIKQAFIHLLGWRQNFNTAEFSISESLTESETGQYFQDMHPLVTLANVRSIAPDFLHMGTVDEWDEETSYRKGQLVKQDDTIYRALQTGTGVDPSDAEYWVAVDLFSEWLQTKTEAAIMKAVETYYSTQMADRTVKNLLESKVLFDGAGRLVDTVRNTGSLVGFEIVPVRAEGVTLKIEKIGLQFNGSGTVKLYLMHSSSPDPVRTVEISYTKKGGMQWADVTDLYLPYVSEDTDAGGSWFLCYNQNELADGVQAVEKNRDWSKEPCSTCSRREYINWQAWSRYLEIHPFRIPAPDEMGMWDVRKNVYTYRTNYGLNLKVTMECDLTDILINQRRAFQNVIGLQVAADMIREFAYNPNFRLNRLQQNFSRNELLYELDGDSTSMKKGLSRNLVGINLLESSPIPIFAVWKTIV